MTTLFLVRFDEDETTFLARAADEDGARDAFLAHCERAGCADDIERAAADTGESVRDLVHVAALPELADGACDEVQLP